MARMLNPGVVLLRTLSFITEHRALSSPALSLSLPIHLLFGTVSYSSQQIRYSLSSISLGHSSANFITSHQLRREISLTRGIHQLPASWNPPQQLDICSSTSDFWLSCTIFNQLAAARNLGAAFASLHLSSATNFCASVSSPSRCI
ncbi:hypothetical protein HDV63DRAFT_255171 [Trichoderma sp. SZMC 28014]